MPSKEKESDDVPTQNEATSSSLALYGTCERAKALKQLRFHCRQGTISSTTPASNDDDGLLDPEDEHIRDFNEAISMIAANKASVSAEEEEQEDEESDE